MLKEGEGADHEEDGEEDESAGGDVADPAFCFGLALQDPDRTEGRDAGGEDHEDVPNDACFAFGAMFSEDFLGVHHSIRLH